MSEHAARQEPLTMTDGCELWSEVGGTGAPLTLVHGGPGWWDMFDDLAPRLARSHRVRRWDQRGCGRSERRGPYTLDTSIADLDAVIGRSPAPSAVIGHSWGATLALLHALRRPEHVRALIYVSGTGLGRDWLPAYRTAVVARLGQERASARPATGDRFVREHWLERVALGFADPDTARNRADLLTRTRLLPNTECNQALDRELAAQSETMLEEACRRLDLPVLIVHGSDDLRPPSVTDSLLTALPRAERQVINGAAHYPWLDRPEAFESIVTEFLASHVSPRRHGPHPPLP